MNVSDFLSQVNAVGGFARPNKFIVSLNALPVITNDNANFDGGGYFSSFDVDTVDVQRRLNFLAHRAEFPSKFFATTDVRHYGPTYKQPYQSIFDDVRISFLVTAGFDEKYFFDSWHYAIEDPLTQDFNYYSEYTTDVTITQYDEMDNIIYAVQLLNAYPIAVGQLELDAAPGNQVHNLTVSFSYQRWLIDGVQDADLETNGSSSGKISKLALNRTGFTPIVPSSPSTVTPPSNSGLPIPGEDQ